MPVRKILKRYVTITGRVARRPNKEPSDFEGFLEKDDLLLLKREASAVNKLADELAFAGSPGAACLAADMPRR